MVAFIRFFFAASVIAGQIVTVTACAGGDAGSGPGHVIGNEAGSAPANKAEVPEYKKAVLRCYLSGGNRVVKIEGKLRCY